MNPEQLFSKYQHLAETTVYKLFKSIEAVKQKYGVEKEDLFQYARESLWESSINFNDSKSKSFKNYAITNMRQALVKWINKDYRKFSFQGTNLNAKDITERTKFISFDSKPFYNDEECSTNHELIGNNYNLESEAIDKIINEKLLDFIPPRTLEFIKLKADGVTIREIGKRYGISHQAVNIHIKKVINKVNRSGYIHELC
jgi:RNA polymerase sigma factor (sigma-70 family)